MYDKVNTICSQLSRTRHEFGWLSAFQAIVDRLGQKLCGLNVAQVVWLNASRLDELDDKDPPFEFRFLTADQIRHFAKDPALDLSDEMAERIDAGRDFCFAALEGDCLAAYGWYALECIEPEHNCNVAMSYSEQTAYMYKGFTHPDYRGLRLHGQGMGLALKRLVDRGVTSLVSTVDWTNQPSLRSCDRLGYERLGNIIAFGSRGQYILRTPSKARRKGVHFGRHVKREAEVKRGRKMNRLVPETRIPGCDGMVPALDLLSDRSAA